MKTLKKLVKFLVVAYLLVSLVLSVVVTVSNQTDEGDFLIEHRAPFIVVDVFASKVAGQRPDGALKGYTEQGEVVGYGENEYSEGDEIVTACLYNPFTSYFDDIVWRADFLRLRAD